MAAFKPIRRALLSVSDKQGIVDLAQVLDGYGVEILSTGGTARLLGENGIKVLEVADYTGMAEMLDGRVKTLHPKIHGGLLALRDKTEHRQALADHNIAPIDLVVITLYPFEETVASKAGPEDCIENIDIGGPAMIRSAAKNHGFVTVLTDPADYAAFVQSLRANKGATSLEFRQAMAAKAFARTASYDAAVSRWFADQQDDPLPERFVLAGSRVQSLRYGENPHQSAAFYATEPRTGLAAAEQVQGKALSYNNLNDTDAALDLIADLPTERPTVAIIKHANPCGVATGATLLEAYERALKGDPVSAFGGIVALNRPLDAATARRIADIFTEVIVAPDADEEARKLLAIKKNLRLLLTRSTAEPAAGLAVKSVAGGFLVQSRDTGRVGEADLTCVTKKSPSPQEMADLLFAFQVAKHVKSNAIVYVRDGMTVGIGAGQMNRRDSARIAARRGAEAAEAAGEPEPLTKGSVVASDAFFPFPDGLLAAAEAGVTAVIQPGGSVKDDAVIAAADDAGLAMVMTGLRHFRH